MEMPELNEDLLEEGEPTSELPSEEPTEGGEAMDGVVPEQNEVEPVQDHEEDTLDGTDGLIGEPEDELQEPQEEGSTAPDELALPQPEEDVPEAKEDETDVEPPVKKAKIEDDFATEPPNPEIPEDETVTKEEQDGGETKAAVEGAQPDTDMLSTLASAALNQDEKPEKSEAPPTPVKEEPAVAKKRAEQWYRVGTYENNTATVYDYRSVTVNDDDPVDVNMLVNIAGQRIKLEPGTAYKLRVCAVNACGAGPWSEVAAFKTTLPGFPGAPSAIKISKSADGAHLTWEPPGGNSGEILEYAVYLAVRSASQGSQPVTTNQAQLAFVRVFCGSTNKCVVGPNSLQAAHIDTTTKPAIIFRIAARNAKGYGPATQVRWLQESANAPAGQANVQKRVTKV